MPPPPSPRQGTASSSIVCSDGTQPSSRERNGAIGRRTAASIDFDRPHWQLGRLDAHTQAALIHKGEVSPIELVRAAFARIEELDPALGSISYRAFDHALRTAERIDRSLPMAGVPLLLKASTSYPGFPHVCGSRARRSEVATTLYPFARALDAAGLIACGMTTMPELGLMGSGEAVIYGPTRNPWDLNRSPGGSSSGSGAAVAAGLVPFATGSDGGGSIRLPAAHCGIVGFKPSRGWNLQARASNLVDDLFACDSLMARTMRDTAWAARYLRRQPVRAGETPRALRIGINLIGLDGREPEPDVAAATRAAGALCASLGHAVEECPLPIDHPAMRRAFEVIWVHGAGEAADMVRARYPDRPIETLLEPWTLGLAAMRDEVSPEELADTLAQFERLHRQMAPHWQRFDLVLSPVADSAALPIGVLDPTRDFATLAHDHFGHVNFTHLQNMGGFPAISLPLGQSPAGLPIGAMFWGPHGADDLLLDLGEALEEAADWRDRWPPLVR